MQSLTVLLSICPQICELEWVRGDEETMFSDTFQYTLRGKNLPWHGTLSSSNSHLEPVFVNKPYQGNFGIWNHVKCLQSLIRPYPDSKDRKKSHWALVPQARDTQL